MQKYEFTGEQHPQHPTLKRLRALIDIPWVSVKSGDLGGWIEKEENLSHEDRCWVSGEAKIYGNARVSDAAYVSDKARVSGNACVSGNAQVSNNARVRDNAQVYGNACVFGSAWIMGNAMVGGYAGVSGHATVSGNALLESPKDYMTFSGLGSEGRFCTLYRTKDGHLLRAGCWTGSVDGFERRVIAVYGEDSDYLSILPALRTKLKQWI